MCLCVLCNSLYWPKALLPLADDSRAWPAIRCGPRAHLRGRREGMGHRRRQGDQRAKPPGQDQRAAPAGPSLTFYLYGRCPYTDILVYPYLKHWKFSSRLYLSRCLQFESHFTKFCKLNAKFYKIGTRLHRPNLQVFLQQMQFCPS